MKKNELLTIEELIINEVEKATEKNILVDLLNEFLIESLEWLQLENDEIKGLNKKVWISNISNELYFRTENIIESFDFLGELNHNYELLEKLNIYDFNFYTVKLESKHVNNINHMINEVISFKVIDYLKDIKDIIFKIIDLYYFTVATEPSMTMPRILTDCYISEKNIELLTDYLINEGVNTSLYVNGLSLDIDTCDDIDDKTYRVLNMFNVLSCY